jgi:3-oxoacyl-[acyl-carrier-protein] synthase II
MAARRVVVTGMGTVNPLGNTVASTWARLMRGDCGVGLARQQAALQALGVPVTIAAEVAADALEPYSAGFPKRTLPSSIAFALAAAQQALAQAQLPASEGQRAAMGIPYASDRMGVAIGTGISGIQDLLAAQEALATRGYRKVSPYLVPNSLVNMAAGLVSIAYGLRGPNHSVSTACTTGAHSIGALRPGHAPAWSVGLAGAIVASRLPCAAQAMPFASSSTATRMCAAMATPQPPSSSCPWHR